MNSRERILAAIAGNPHDRVPVAQHNFAFCVRHSGITMGAYRREPELAAHVLVDAAEELGYDCIIIDFDTCSLAEAMGAQVEFPENDIALSIKKVADRACIWGNINPALLSQGSADDVLAACRPVLKSAVKLTQKFVLCPGCLANADVPAANIRAMTDAASQWGRYPTGSSGQSSQ